MTTPSLEQLKKRRKEINMIIGNKSPRGQRNIYNNRLNQLKKDELIYREKEDEKILEFLKKKNKMEDERYKTKYKIMYFNIIKNSNRIKRIQYPLYQIELF